jgi:predicted MPP superfamily phosphohydrolase
MARGADMIDRRRFLAGAAALPLLGVASGVYAFGVEPEWMRIKRYALTPPLWPVGLSLRLVIIADLHACEPYMPAERIRRICLQANALRPDAILLLGDYNAGHRFVTRPVNSQQIGEALSVLRAPQGVFAILGNHDWRHGDLLDTPSDGTVAIRRALAQAGVKLLENDAVPRSKDGQSFWFVGLGDQLIYPTGYNSYKGVDDLDGALAKVTDAAPVILLAHEPMIFKRTPKRVSLTLCGHTHGGQVNLPLIGPVASEVRFGSDLVYGHIIRDERHLIVSAGLGESRLPIRFRRPPELVEVTLGTPALI